VTKLARVLLVVPIIISLGWRTRRSPGHKQASIPMPWFVLFFALLVLANSLNLIAAPIKTVVLDGNQWLLCMSLVAMGLETNVAALAELGLKPVFLAGLSWLFLAVTSLAMIGLGNLLT
ncbi:MAG: putative sulfate exporter family transporter, partial [Nodosilinea sp.]